LVLYKYKGNYTFAGLHPNDNQSPINHGFFNLIGMKYSRTTLSINGNPGLIKSIGQVRLINMGEIPITGLYYQVSGTDNIVQYVEVDHPSTLLGGLTCRFHFLPH
jgi:hypothetical protein